MNNGKLRIYELSKELNLDNKDILDICEQLNIVVKSHSSTITESQAERIKATAEKYTPSHPVGKSHATPSHEGSSGSPMPQPSVQAKGERKQQILAIHHRQNRPNSTSDAQLSMKSATPVLANPPRPPVKPKPSTQPNLPQVSHSVPDSPPVIEDTQSQSPLLSVQTVKVQEKVASVSSVQSPQLLKPPARLDQGQRGGKAGNKLIPKPVQKTESSGTATESTLISPKSVKEGSKVGLEPVGKRQRDENKSVIELQKPQRNKPAKENKLDLVSLTTPPEADLLDDETLVEADTLETITKQKPKLKQRPTPPRQSKRPIWEEEEEEQDIENKAKAAAKTKRRTLIVEDDEDDLVAELAGISIPTSVSLSVARPPKPQTADKQTEGTSTSNSSRLKKAAPKTDSSANKGKNERRERKEAVKLPESVVLSGSLTVRELSELLRTPETDIIKILFFKGIAVNITQTLELETARLVTEELGIQVQEAEETAAATKVTEMLDAKDLENLQRRPPVVTIMGHVDHGKTTLLDSIRKTKVAQGEAGGITQHIGAYHVDVEHEDKQQQVVFLDTPGHEAFTAMRARGARVTDIAILVVAADDGVQPQTREAVSHAKAAEVPIVVAVNKVDKAGAEPDRVKQELTDLGLVPEEWGGDTIMVPVSALKGENLDTLLEMILLVAELEELSANPNRPAKGTVIEANLDRTRGPVATLLVQNGTLRVGDTIVAGSVLGKIRAMIDDRGNKVEAATPSFAVEVLGLSDVPAAGDEFDVFASEKEARALADQRSQDKRHTRLQQAMSSRRVTLSSLSAQAQEGQLKELNLILKADVQGSVEAILGSLKQLPQNEVQIRVLLAAPGEVTETDVDLAAASGAVIIGFNTTLATGARQAADQEGVDIREYNIIYKLLDEIEGAMEGLLDPEEVEEALGQAEVRAVFPVGRGAVAGCYVLSGKIVRNRNLRVRRGNQVIHEGVVESLKRIKEDAKEVNAGYECGIGAAKFHEWKEGDIIEAYQMTMKRRTLSPN